MDSSRRRFLKMAGIAAVGLGTQPVISGSGRGRITWDAAQRSQKGEALLAKHWAMVIDTRKLQHEEDIEPLIEVCHAIHNVPTSKTKIMKSSGSGKPIITMPSRTMPTHTQSEEVDHRPFLVLCNHCQNPPCVRACPTQATFKRESDGIVLMDFHRCIGCRFCMAACPYGSRSFNFRDPRPFIEEQNKAFPTRMKGVVEKCNFCAERLAVGQQPACVEASNGAIVFGDLDDPDSEVREVLRHNFTIRRKQSLGTEPCVYYIV
jgi:Fe-S-cluster-containing dehydrogenase component